MTTDDEDRHTHRRIKALTLRPAFMLRGGEDGLKQTETSEEHRKIKNSTAATCLPTTRFISPDKRREEEETWNSTWTRPEMME